MPLDIKTMSPEAYAQALREQGVREDDLAERIAHDLLLALASEFQTAALPPEYHDMAQTIGIHLRTTADDETAH